MEPKTCGQCKFCCNDDETHPYCPMNDLYTFILPTDEACEHFVEADSE